MVKTILEVGESGTGKPGRPYIVKVNLLGYFAPSDVEASGKAAAVKDVANTAEE